MKEVSCKQILALNERYAQGLLGEDQIALVRDHWSVCPACRKAFEETRAVWTLLKLDRPSDPGPEFWEGMRSLIMRQVRQVEAEAAEVPWYLKIFRNPFGWPGYAWAASLILILFVPIVLYTINNQDLSQLKGQSVSGGEEPKYFEMSFEPLSTLVDSLSEKESVRLAGKVVARLGKGLSDPRPFLSEEESHWDISRSTEGLDEEELEALIKKMEPGNSTVFKEGETNAC